VSGPFRDTSTDNLRRLIEVNVVAPAELTRQALDGMLERRFGRIVFMSSLSAEVALPGLVAYSATKAAISQLADGLRDELAGSGIGITLVEIGGAVTEMYETARSYKPTADGFDRAYKLGMLRELGADEVARAIAKAIERDRPSVVLPRRGRTQYAMARAPQAIARLVGIVR
jgi:short-subunit dehydrogenase